MDRQWDVVVVGAGIFGITAAIALRERGMQVAVLDPGPLPNPLAASTDISKVVRIEYGPDVVYAQMAETAREGWLHWNTELFSAPLYHETGVTMLTRGTMTPGNYEYENFRVLRERGHAPERLTQAAIARRLPAWNADVFSDGYFNAKGGFVESGRVVEQLEKHAGQIGVALYPSQTVGRVAEQAGVASVRTREDRDINAEHVLIAIGAWTPLLLPELAGMMRSVGQPVFHLRPTDPSLFEPPRFFVFGADSSRTGWYGFPLHPSEGVVKIANHGPGRPVDAARDERVVLSADVERLRTFLAEAFPPLAAAPIVHTRCCLYCDTPDEHFWIARHPEYTNLTVAAGDSGHAFKFAPILGGLIADAVEDRSNPLLSRFAWRASAAPNAGQEASRYRGEPSEVRS